MEEVWKDIKGYEGLYQVSNFGRIKSFVFWNGKKYIKKEHFVHPYRQKVEENYYRYKVVLVANKQRKYFSVHRLVAEAFIPNPNNYLEINHIDSDTSNNNVNNLEWCTHRQNMIHSGKSLRRNVIKDPQKVQEIIDVFINNELSRQEILIKYNISPWVFYGIMKRNNIKHSSKTKYNIDKKELIECFEKGMRNNEIAKKFNCTYNLISTYRYKYKKGMKI